MEAKFKQRIGIAGAGGLGSNVAAHLVRSGIRRFIIADFDVVNESNLNRQFYFRHQIGCKKVVALSENLRLIEPDLDLELVDKRLDALNISAVFAACDIVVEAFDAASAKAMLVSTLLPQGKKIVAASGLAGYGRSNAIRLRKAGENLVLAGDFESAVSQDMPPASPRVGIAAAMQANAVMAMLLGVEL